MMRIVDYQVISAATDTDLVEKVKFAIKDGWEPHGGVAYIPPPSSSHNVSSRCSQAMVIFGDYD